MEFSGTPGDLRFRKLRRGTARSIGERGRQQSQKPSLHRDLDSIGVAVEALDPATLPGWDLPDSPIAMDFGDRWLAEARSPVLVVPSVVAQRERNVLINQVHPDFQLIKAGTPEPVRWDARLWGRQSS